MPPTCDQTADEHNIALSASKQNIYKKFSDAHAQKFEELFPLIRTVSWQRSAADVIVSRLVKTTEKII